MTAAYGANKPNKKAWLLVINCTFKSVEDRDKFIGYFSKLAPEVAHNEPGMLGYELSIADNDPLKVIIFERYATKEDWAGPHRDSAAYKEFQAAVAASGIEFESKTGQSYYEQDIGFM